MGMKAALQEFVQAWEACGGYPDNTSEIGALEAAYTLAVVALAKESQHVEQEPPVVEIKTPAEMRAAGRPYCPKCYTFGHEHRADCKYRGHGMAYHVKQEGMKNG